MMVENLQDWSRRAGATGRRGGVQQGAYPGQIRVLLSTYVSTVTTVSPPLITILQLLHTCAYL